MRSDIQEWSERGTGHMTARFQEWLAEHGLEGAADELLMFGALDLSGDEISWLRDFCEAWDEAQAREDEAYYLRKFSDRIIPVESERFGRLYAVGDRSQAFGSVSAAVAYLRREGAA